MCQTSVLLDRGEAGEELLLENVTALEVIPTGFRITTLFEGSRDFEKMALSRIDFTGGKVYLVSSE